MAFTEQTLRSAMIEYDEAKRDLLAQRDARLRAFHANGWRPVDLQRITGYSRETIRHALHPEAREAANATRRKPTRNVAPARTPVRPGGYGQHKPYVVAEDLGALRGPTQGSVTLPHHLDWSGRAVYDLDRPARMASLYKTVLNEASSAQDLTEWLDGRVLIELWPTLWLPPRLRALWESRFPELAARRTAAA
jgi:hypothetical protein